MESVTIKDIARKCNVAVSTVSRAINNHPDINEETRQKIMRVIEENNYIPNNSAQNLKKSASKTIGIMVKGMDNPLFGKMRRVLEENIEQYQYQVYFQYVSISDDEVEDALRLIKERKLKGLIFLGGNHNRTEEEFSRIPVPFVISTVNIDESVSPCVYSSVAVDSCRESCRMMEILCKRGYKKIAFLAASPGDESVGRLRLKGYKDALAVRGIPVDEDLIVFSQDWAEDVYSMANGYRMTRSLMASGKEFDCIFAVADSVAMGACRALLESGKRIPEDCAVAGFDGVDETGYYYPSITTMRQPVERMAEETVKILFSMLHKGEKHQHRLFPCELMEREST